MKPPEKNRAQGKHLFFITLYLLRNDSKVPLDSRRQTRKGYMSPDTSYV